MSEVIDLSAYRDKPSSPPPLEKDGDGGDSGGMEPRIASLEAHMDHVRADLGVLKSDVATLKTDVATLKERVTHLPSKGFIVLVTTGALGLLAALSVFGPNVRALLGLH